jgi:hypothetical protein
MRQDHVRTSPPWATGGATAPVGSLGRTSCAALPTLADGSAAASAARAARGVLAAASLALVCAACSLAGDPAAHPPRGLAPPPPGLSGPAPPASYVPGPEAILALLHGSGRPESLVLPLVLPTRRS